MPIVTLKPGYLVSLRTTVDGGVQYDRTDVSAEQSGGALTEEWRTVKVVDDVALHKRATEVRSKCSSLVRGVCSHSAFGLLCQGSREKELDAAIEEARRRAEVFNAESEGAVRVSVYVLKGRIAESDAEAARAISGEMRELLEEMRAGVEEVNVTKIRDAASRAKRVGAMLDERAQERVSAAIAEARAVAREIVKRVSDGADASAYVAREVKLQAVEAARFAFLDLDAPKESGEEALPPVDAREVDFDVGGDGEDDVDASRAVDEDASAMAASAPELELEL